MLRNASFAAWLISEGLAVSPSSSPSGLPREMRERGNVRRASSSTSIQVCRRLQCPKTQFSTKDGDSDANFLSRRHHPCLPSHISTLQLRSPRFTRSRHSLYANTYLPRNCCLQRSPIEIFERCVSYCPNIVNFSRSPSIALRLYCDSQHTRCCARERVKEWANNN